MRVLQVTAELFPLLKTGGLADVAGALPAALRGAGCELRPLLPAFPSVVAGFEVEQDVAEIALPWGPRVGILRGTLPALRVGEHEVTGYLVDAPSLYDRPGDPYHDQERRAYDDNHLRFAALGVVAAALANGADPSWSPDVVHAHDWHAGLVPAYLRARPTGGRRVSSVFTVHNLAYQGVFDASCLAELGLPAPWFAVDGLEFHGQLSFLKAGLYYADELTTVSPTYAREIQGPDQGCGLHGLLAGRSDALTGILNGVDPGVWNPRADSAIASQYWPQRMAGKAQCKAALQARVGLDDEPNAPLFAVVSRLTEQKGMHLVAEGASEILRQGGQLFVLGTGESDIEGAFAALAASHRGRIAARFAYDETFAHEVFAGADVTLVPSRFEPCGLTQLYGLAYGAIPLVRRVGGLADTVVDADLATLEDGTATGIVFDGFDVPSFAHGVRRAAALYRQGPVWRRVRRHGMQQRFDWATAASAYAELYRRAQRNAAA